MADLQDRIHDYLKGRPPGSSAEDIAVEALRLRGGTARTYDRVVEAALKGDARFSRTTDGKWRLAPPRKAMPADRVAYTAVSLRPLPRTDRAMEIGAVRTSAGRVETSLFRCLALGDPSQEVRSSSEEVVPALEALTELASFAADSTLVAHDLRGTLARLEWEARRAGAPLLAKEGLSLRRLGRRLFPDLRIRSVADLAGALGISRQEQGRADREAGLIASALPAVLERCRRQGAVDLEAVLALQEPDLEGVDFGAYDFDRTFLEGLPELPGVYLMSDRKGVLLYVGKARSLRDRVSTYFARTTRRSEKMRGFLQRVYDLRVEVVGSELEALLLEGRLIREHRPEFNVQVEVHERPSAPSLGDAVFVLPSGSEGCVELFMVRNGTGLRQVRAHQDLSDIDEVAAALEGFYGDGGLPEGMDEEERLDAELARTWLAGHGEGVSRMDLKGVRNLEDGIRLLRDYIAGCAPEWERVTYV